MYKKYMNSHMKAILYYLFSQQTLVMPLSRNDDAHSIVVTQTKHNETSPKDVKEC